MLTKISLALAIVPLLAPLIAVPQTSPRSTAKPAAKPETAFKVGDGVTAPRAIYSPDPEYSEEARKAKRQGTCVLWLVVGPDGRVRDIRVVQSLGMGLDEKAIEAVGTWKFEPGLKDGKPVAVQLNVDVSFKLYEGNDQNDPEIQALRDRLKTMPNPYPPVVTKVEPCSVPASSHESVNPQITVAELVFQGALQLPPSDQSEIADSIKRHVYTGNVDRVTDEVTQRVKSAWQKYGYAKVAVTADSRVLTSNAVAARIALVVHVNEGNPYRLQKITFSNNRVITDAQALRNQFHIQDGDLFDGDAIRQGFDNLRKAYGQLGYLEFTAVPNIRFNEEESVASLEIDLNEAKQFIVSDVTILGTDENSVQSAANDLPFRPGDIYDEHLVELFLSRTALQRSAKPSLQMDKQEGTVAITFDLRHCEAAELPELRTRDH